LFVGKNLSSYSLANFSASLITSSLGLEIVASIFSLAKFLTNSSCFSQINLISS
jgi:hypothetical protein